MSIIIFNEKNHSYLKGKYKYNSVSSLVSRYKQPYDREFWSFYGACKEVLGPTIIRKIREELQMELYGTFNPRDLRDFSEKEKFKKLLDQYIIETKANTKIKKTIGVILKDWKKRNKDSVKKGNDYHDYQESKAKYEGVMYNPHRDVEFPTIESTKIYKKKGVEYRESIYKLEELPDGFHPELILWNDDYNIAGQSDKVFIETIGNVRYIDVDDYKTNNKIDKTSMFGKMKDPLSHLDDCNYNHYRLQTSVYAWILEQAGYTVRSVRFSHLNTPYTFEYMKWEVEAMLGVTKDFNYL